MDERNPNPLKNTPKVQSLHTLQADMSALQSAAFGQQTPSSPEEEIPVDALVRGLKIIPIKKAVQDKRPELKVPQTPASATPIPQPIQVQTPAPEPVIPPAPPTPPTPAGKPAPFIGSNPFLESQGIAKSDQLPPEINLLEKKKNLSPIRTFTSDVSDAVQKEGMSLSRIAIAENQRRVQMNTRQSVETSHLLRTFFIFFLSGILVAGGLGATYYFIVYKNTNNATIPTSTAESNSFMATEKITKISLSTTGKEETIGALLSEVQRSDTKLFEMENVQLFSDAQKKIPKTASSLIGIIGKGAPDAMVRSLEDDFFFGTYNTSANNPILIFRTKSYEAALAGMLAWEKNILRDLQGLFLGIDDRVVGTSFTSKSGTIYQFQDALINNKEARVLRNSLGQIVFIYSLIDSKHIVITTNESVLKEVMSRIVKNKTTR